MPRKRSNLKQHMEFLPAEYHEKKAEMTRYAIIIIAFIFIFILELAICMLFLNERVEQINSYGLKVQMVTTVNGEMEVINYYTDKIEVRDGYVYFIDDKGVQTTVGEGSLIIPDRIHTATN